MAIEREVAPYYRVSLGGGGCPNSTTMLEMGWSFILWPMLYLKDWSSRSSYFIGVA